MNQDIKDQCYILSIKGYQGKEIAKKLNLTPMQVSRAINSITKSHDYQLATSTIGTFLEEFQRTFDFMKLKQAELEEMKPEDNKEKLAITALQIEIATKALTFAQQGKVVMALQALRDGQLKLNETN